jgi:phosphoribosylcarboxyaminoimidazole (NCAIR) mutase
VAINNSTNAALLALRILGSSHPELLEAMEDYLASLNQEVNGKIDKLENVGWREYLNKK